MDAYVAKSLKPTKKQNCIRFKLFAIFSSFETHVVTKGWRKILRKENCPNMKIVRIGQFSEKKIYRMGKLSE